MRRTPASYYDQRYYTHIIYHFFGLDGVPRLARLRLVPADGREETGLPSPEDQKEVWYITFYISFIYL